MCVIVTTIMFKCSSIIFLLFQVLFNWAMEYNSKSTHTLNFIADELHMSHSTVPTPALSPAYEKKSLSY